MILLDIHLHTKSAFGGDHLLYRASSTSSTDKNNLVYDLLSDFILCAYCVVCFIASLGRKIYAQAGFGKYYIFFIRFSKFL